MYVEVLLIALIATLASGWIWHPITWPMIYPLVSGFFVGLILGDPVSGMIAGGYINLLYLGWITVGGAMSGNIMFAGVFGTALTLIANLEPIIAPVLAFPLALVGLLLWNLQMTLNAKWITNAEKHAEKGNIRGVEFSAYLYPQLTVFAIQLFPSFLLLYFCDSIGSLGHCLSGNLLNAMVVAGGMLPAFGIALMLKYLTKAKIIAFFLVGYFVALLLNMNMIVMALSGILFIAGAYLFKAEDSAACQKTAEVDRLKFKNRILRNDLLKHWLRGYSQEAGYNYKKLQAGGTCAAMAPIIRRLYKNQLDTSDALKRYLVFFNTEPAFIGPFISGVAANMEEQKANNSIMSDTDINNVRTGLMGPLAGIGDSLAHGTIYPILVTIALSLTIAGNMFGPAIFLLVFGGAMLFIGYNTYMLGYNRGKEAVKIILKNKWLSRRPEAIVIVGVFLLGGLSAKFVCVQIAYDIILFSAPLVINAALQTLLYIFPPLLMVIIIWLILRKRLAPTITIASIIAIATIGTYLGIFTPGVELY